MCNHYLIDYPGKLEKCVNFISQLTINKTVDFYSEYPMPQPVLFGYRVFFPNLVLFISMYANINSLNIYSVLIKSH